MELESHTDLMVSVSLTGERLASAADDDGAELTGRLRALQTRWDAVSGRLLELQRRRPAPATAAASASASADDADHGAGDGGEEESDGQVRTVCGEAGGVLVVVCHCSVVTFCVCVGRLCVRASSWA